MKAPDKIYLQVCGDCPQSDCDDCNFEDLEDNITWCKDRIFEKDVEYIRADAFIEKACDAYCKVCGHYPHTTPKHICRQTCDYYKDFKNYMKGE